jgi:hypothetical protein
MRARRWLLKSDTLILIASTPLLVLVAVLCWQWTEMPASDPISPAPSVQVSPVDVASVTTSTSLKPLADVPKTLEAAAPAVVDDLPIEEPVPSQLHTVSATERTVVPGRIRSDDSSAQDTRTTPSTVRIESVESTPEKNPDVIIPHEKY